MDYLAEKTFCYVLCFSDNFNMFIEHEHFNNNIFLAYSLFSSAYLNIWYNAEDYIILCIFKCLLILEFRRKSQLSAVFLLSAIVKSNCPFTLPQEFSSLYLLCNKVYAKLPSIIDETVLCVCVCVCVLVWETFWTICHFEINTQLVQMTLNSFLKTWSLTEFDTIDYFSNYSGLNSNIWKCEIAGGGALKGVHVAAYGLKSVDMRSDTMKILGVHFSLNKKLQNLQKNSCKVILDVQNTLKSGRMGSQTIEGKIKIVQTWTL